MISFFKKEPGIYIAKQGNISARGIDRMETIELVLHAVFAESKEAEDRHLGQNGWDDTD